MKLIERTEEPGKADLATLVSGSLRPSSSFEVRHMITQILVGKAEICTSSHARRRKGQEGDLTGS